MEQRISSLDEFYTAMKTLRMVRYKLLQDYMQKKTLNLSTLEEILAQLESIPMKGDKYLLTVSGELQAEIELDYEITEIKKDLFFLTHTVDDFLDHLTMYTPTLHAEAQTLVKKIKDIKYYSFISDRDGTINNYCGRYASSIQPIYNAYFLTLFAQVIPQKVLLTSAPLENPGIVDISVAPEGTFIYAASKGREYTGYDTVRKQFPVDSEQAARLSQLNTKLTKLVQQPENRAFGLIGSALQLKFGQTTIARQDIAKSIPSTDSEAFLSTIKKLVKDLDPKKEYFRIEDTGLDIEILLTVQGDKNDTLRDFDKGDGVAYLNSDVPLNMKTGAALICGDTNSDVPMISAAQALTDDVTSIFVTTNQALKEKVLNIDPHAYFVSSPDVLITVLLGYALNQKQD